MTTPTKEQIKEENTQREDPPEDAETVMEHRRAVILGLQKGGTEWVELAILTFDVPEGYNGPDLASNTLDGLAQSKADGQKSIFLIPSGTVVFHDEWAAYRMTRLT